MDALTAITERRSVKVFDATAKIPQAEIDRLLELLLLSPTSFNIQNWRFVAVQNPEVKQQLRAAAWNQAQVEEAPLVVVFCADLQAHCRQPERYWCTAPQATRDMLVPMIGRFYNDNPQLQRDEAMRSCGIAAQTLMVAAKAMGYDTNAMVGYDPKQVAEIIHLPADHEICLMVAVGKALKPAYPRGGQLPLREVVFVDHFPQ